MADKKISELVSATVVNTTDFFPLVQAGTTLKLDMNTFLTNLPIDIKVVQPAETPVSGAISTAVRASLISSATGATNYTLAAGKHGSKKIIACNSLGASATAVVTVTGGTGFTTLTFNAIGQVVTLENISGNWYVDGFHGATIA
jgi:hypothetical protein